MTSQVREVGRQAQTNQRRVETTGVSRQLAERRLEAEERKLERRSGKIPPVLKLSVTIITLNEAEHIGAAIDSVRWADEIVVVDSGSKDGTTDIARTRGATVITREWPGYVDQKELRGRARIPRLDFLARRRRTSDARARGGDSDAPGGRTRGSCLPNSPSDVSPRPVAAVRPTSTPIRRHGCTTDARRAGAASTCTSR